MRLQSEYNIYLMLSKTTVTSAFVLMSHCILTVIQVFVTHACLDVKTTRQL